MIISHIPKIMKEKGLSVMDLVYGARITPATSRKLFEMETVPDNTLLSPPVIESVCKFLNKGVGELYEFVPDMQE